MYSNHIFSIAIWMNLILCYRLPLGASCVVYLHLRSGFPREHLCNTLISELSTYLKLSKPTASILHYCPGHTQRFRFIPLCVCHGTELSMDNCQNLVLQEEMPNRRREHVRSSIIHASLYWFHALHRGQQMPLWLPISNLRAFPALHILYIYYLTEIICKFSLFFIYFPPKCVHTTMPTIYPSTLSWWKLTLNPQSCTSAGY